MKNKSLIIALIIIAVVAGVIYASTDRIEKLTYHNTKYGYEIRYPAGVDVLSGETGLAPLSLTPESKSVMLLSDQGGLLFEIASSDLDDLYFDFSGDIASIAERIRDIQVKDENPYVHNKIVGMLESMVIGGQSAYSFTLMGSLSYLGGGGYTLDSEYVYLVTQDSRGNKYLIRYPFGNAVAQEIVESFKFIK